MGKMMDEIKRTAAREAAQAAREKGICPVCGEATEAHHKFCGHCGCDLNAGMQHIDPRKIGICLHCGNHVEVTHDFCAECGHDLREGAWRVDPRLNVATA